MNSGFRRGLVPRSSQSEGGFTLIELLVVCAVIAILMAIVLSLSSYAMRKSDEGRAIADLIKIKAALEEHRIAYGNYPTNHQEGSSINWVAQLWVRPQQDGRLPFLKGKFLNDTNTPAPYIDPWGNEYRYTNNAAESRFTYSLWSLGPDVGSSSDDIANWEGDF